MSQFFYALNIATLATWLSVAGFGTIGMVVPVTVKIFQQKERAKDPSADLESIVLTENFTSGEPSPTQETATATTGQANEEQETAPTPPEMPEIAEISPLPEIPDMPTPILKFSETTVATPTKPRPAATSGSPSGKPSRVGQNGGSGMSDAKRLAGGRMPPPSYPPEARAKGKTGTVLVEFVVGENGSVVSAYPKSPSPWPILNEHAVSCVRSWKFPPGGVTKFVRPIVFELK